MEGFARTPNDQPLAIEILQFLTNNKKWSQAALLAEKMKAMDVKNLEALLLMSRAIQQSGNPAGAKILVEKVILELGNLQVNQKNTLERNYNDVFIINQSGEMPVKTEKK